MNQSMMLMNMVSLPTRLEMVDLESEGDEVHAYQEVKFGEVVDV
ncbi:unnamed protein product [Brassica rapa]|uniref:Uncharacterized protein n=1 Tax=Brassica campestris TaxID=3711 RepID=A0A8D9MAH4_BRACM|nr:unnamed protein product [Brassica rapa]